MPHCKNHKLSIISFNGIPIMSARRVFYTCHQGKDKDIKAERLKRELTLMKKVA